MQAKWVILEPAPPSFLEEFPQLPPLVANLLYNRDIRTQEKIDEFLNPDYSQDVHDPFIFGDMKKAVNRVLKAVEKNERITIHGDYDADGVSAAVILTNLFEALGFKNYDVFLPHRETDGYGLNMETIKILYTTGTKLIITCDCGISNYEEIELANKFKMDVIVTDHHTVPEKLPPALAIIHPKLEKEKYPDKNLAGGAVAFKLMQGVLEAHKKNNEILPNGQKHEAFEKWQLDMVAIASVADMVPLIGESRTLTKYGLTVLNKTKRTGLQKLLLEARLLQENGDTKKPINADTIGFQIAPRINAAGRMNHANVAYKLFTTKDETDASQLAFELNNNNKDRQKMTDDLLKQAVKQVEETQKDNPILFVLGQGWSTGIVGLISGRLKEKYYKPSLVMAENNGEITGSGRSIENFNLIESLQEMPDYFLKFGGHPMACGFSLKDKNLLEDFKKDLINKFNEKTKGFDMSPVLKIDAEIDLENVNWELYDLLSKFEPFGKANEKPKYLARGLTVHSLLPVGKDGKHLRIMVKHNTEKIQKTIGWSLCNGNGVNWCQELKIGDKIDMVFEMDVNEWNGNREIQLTIADLHKTDNTDDTTRNTNTRMNANYANHANIDNDNVIYKDLSYKINNILFSVHNELGRYCNEKQISDAIENKLKQNNIKYEREKILPESFEGERFARNRIDFLVEDKIIVEIKVKKIVGKEEYYQCLRYLESMDKKLCLLVNFRDKHLKIKRILNPKSKI
ncbi:MAG: single-stranded-DNA-specific exonuclease RecJ [Candidatus Magasanikbacteria bacterium RIFOXYA1_FULL_40_8]|uniref:Single-stranded-DNA-specific exonuclease RecJ n=2 Tax=Candidatus Magasanikiibacteriota TaxID=1752731 RepID=A0A1F6NTL0_9BACT|nr:MAG: single-stranded-DNA-specific exonuclease RecJ [Candidatus Magasanikbacteria bacterium RIFOXYA1_FULL_40_8]